MSDLDRRVLLRAQGAAVSASIVSAIADLTAFVEGMGGKPLPMSRSEAMRTERLLHEDARHGGSNRVYCRACWRLFLGEHWARRIESTEDAR